MPSVGSIGSCPFDEFRRDSFAEFNPSRVVHRIMNASPYAGISGFFADLANELRATGKQVCEDFTPRSRESGVVGWIAGKVGHGKQRSYLGVELMGTKVPVGKLPVIAGNERIEQDRPEQCICTRSARRILSILSSNIHALA